MTLCREQIYRGLQLGSNERKPKKKSILRRPQWLRAKTNRPQNATELEAVDRLLS